MNTVKTLTQPAGTEKPFRLGRNRPVARGPRVMLCNYLKQSLPKPPTRVNYVPPAAAPLARMYANDSLGDCVPACMTHVQGVLTGNAGIGAQQFSDTDVINLYSAIGGYVPGDPATDNGCDEQTALNYWQQFGLLNGAPNPHKIQAWVSVNGANLTEVHTALWLFENLMFGVELPDAWVNPMPGGSNFTWGVAGDPDPSNGHCFAGCGYDRTGVRISTWGMLGVITAGAIAKYTAAPSGELYSVLSPESIRRASGKAPSGFDFSQLLADLDSMGLG